MDEIGSVVVKVSPEVLVTQAEEVRRLGKDMKNRFQTLQNTIERTREYWIGDAGELHRKLCDEQKDAIDRMLRRLLEHPDDLLAISENYRATERTNVESAAVLDTDIII